MNTNRRRFIKASSLSGLAAAWSSIGLNVFATTKNDVLVVQTGLLTDSHFTAGVGATINVSVDLKRADSYQTLVSALKQNSGINVFALVDGSTSFMLEEAVRDSDTDLIAQVPVSLPSEDINAWAYHTGRQLSEAGFAKINDMDSETTLIAFQIRT